MVGTIAACHRNSTITEVNTKQVHLREEEGSGGGGVWGRGGPPPSGARAGEGEKVSHIKQIKYKDE